MSAIRVASTLLRTARPAFARTGPAAAAPFAARPFSTSSPVALPPSKALASSAGSGQGGKAEKEAARKEKERAKKEKERERARKDKERLKAQKEREKAKAQREKEKDKAQKEKEKLKLQREKEKAKADKKPRTTSVLRPPKAPATAWSIFLADFIAQRKREIGPGEKLASLTELTKAAGAEYSTLDSSTKADLQQRADEQRAAYPAILDAWRKSLTPEMIKEENAVRATRRKLGLSRKANLRLEGEPKRPSTAYFMFAQEQRASGDVFRGENNIIEQSRLMAAAWRALSEDEKKPYEERYQADKVRYEKEKSEFDAKHAASAGPSSEV
ncbi:hypothetical protein JCM10212_001358 [Sporobolomyces blumeae]